MGYPVHSYGTGQMLSQMNRREDKDERHTNELITAIRQQASAGTASEGSFGIVEEKYGPEMAQGLQNVNTQAKEDNKLKREKMLFDKRLTASKLAGSYVDQGYKFLEMGEKELAQQAFNMAQPVYDKLGQKVNLSSLIDEKTTREEIKKANLSSLTKAIQNIKTPQDVQNANIMLQNYKATNKADDLSVIEKMISNANARIIAKTKVKATQAQTLAKEKRGKEEWDRRQKVSIGWQRKTRTFTDNGQTMKQDYDYNSKTREEKLVGKPYQSRDVGSAVERWLNKSDPNKIF